MKIAGMNFGADSKKNILEKEVKRARSVIDKNISGNLSVELGQYTKRNVIITHAQKSERGLLGFANPVGKSIQSLRRYIEKCETWLNSYSKPGSAVAIIDAVHRTACSKNKGKLPKKDSACYRKFLEEVSKRLTVEVNKVITAKIVEIAGTSENIIVYESVNLSRHTTQSGLKNYALSVLPRNILDECRAIDEVLTSFKRL